MLTGEFLPVPCANVGEGSGEDADEVEAILLEHLQSCNRTALFPLGQFYYEQVSYAYFIGYSKQQSIFLVLVITALLHLHCTSSAGFVFITEYCLKWPL